MDSSKALFLDPSMLSPKPPICFFLSEVCIGFSTLRDITDYATTQHSHARTPTMPKQQVLQTSPCAGTDSVAEKLPNYLRSDVAPIFDFLHPQWTNEYHPTNLGIGCKVIQSCDVQPELVSLSEFSEAGPQRHQLVPGDVGGQLQNLLTEGVITEEEGVRGGKLVGPSPPPGSTAVRPAPPHLT